jgi:hypothetical protein
MRDKREISNPKSQITSKPQRGKPQIRSRGRGSGFGALESLNPRSLDPFPLKEVFYERQGRPNDR